MQLGDVTRKDQIPYVESGTYVAYNNEKGGVIESLKEDGIVDLDSEVHSVPEWISTKAMVNSWLADALMYELRVGSDGSSAHKVYYSDLPWPIGKFLYFKQVRITKQLLEITKENADRREEEIYRRATVAYGALSTRLGDQSFLFESRPTSLDAVFLGHALFVLHALPDTSVLRSKLVEHSNLVQYADKLKMEFIDGGSSSSTPPFPADPSSSFQRRGGTSNWCSKPKSKPKKEKTEEERKFRRRAKYFLVTQLVAVLVFLSLLGGSDDAEVELDDDDSLNYND
ncbi:mitochondrial outer membrane import complex protein METAXIN-like isoform X3 [Camellia sinensis]|uniref:mitochondrial outer membrane import complex protein METAXIN-like isoform X3 n=1 Tax=Camellia sinensis TaxID=4442 RepID=UPI00103553C0|nr:mitochondrial outer membrane import complex protein METAXIN-like isoform X3 [Camellia sinensis]